MMVAIKELLSVPSLLLLLLFISSVNSRGVKQFRSGECSLSKASHKKYENWNVNLTDSARHRLQVRLGEETRQVLVRSSRARSIDRNTDRRGRDTKLDVSLGRHQATGMSSPLARRRFNRAGGGRTRAGRQEMSAAPVFPNFEVLRILFQNSSSIFTFRRPSVRPWTSVTSHLFSTI